MTARRGSILLLVLVVIAVAALIVATALRQSLASGWSAAAADRQLESRLAAWSGIEMVMAELQSQRPQLLIGASPTITDQVVVRPLAEGAMLVRLVPFEAGSILPEGGKLDLNTAPVEWLARLPGFDTAAATAIDVHRCRIAFGSVAELQQLGYDPLGLALVTREPDVASEAQPEALINWLTVFSADAPEPAMDPFAETACLCEELSEAARKSINDLAGLDLATLLTARAAEGNPIATRADFASLALGAGVDIRKVGELLDRITLTKGPALEPVRRIDLNTAAAEVLATLPGLDIATARQIVEARDRVGTVDRLNVLWPAFAAGVEIGKLLPAIDHLGVRSMVWRVRVEAGRASSLEAYAEVPALSSRVSLEAVIDLSTDRPRVVYLRDVSHLAIARRLSDILPVPESDAEAETSDSPPPPTMAAGPLEPDPPPTRPSGRVSRWSVPK